MPEVSVVIPLFNKGPYIARALDSVLNQTFQDFEVIVVDDGSTDDGAETVRGYSDPRIRLIRQENRGVSAARNRGIEAAAAELIAFLDADDEYLPTFLETVLRLRKLYPEAGLYGTAYEEHVAGSIVLRTYRPVEGDRLLNSYFGAIVALGADLFNASSHATQKEILLDVGGYPAGVKWNEDGTVAGKIALRFPVAYSPDVCSVYHKYTMNKSGTKEYADSPFLQYISTIPKEDLEERDDIDDIREYCDLCRLAAAARNIYAGFGARARPDLVCISSPCCTSKKRRLWILSLFPPFIPRAIRRNARTLSYIKRRIVRS